MSAPEVTLPEPAAAVSAQARRSRLAVALDVWRTPVPGDRLTRWLIGAALLPLALGIGLVVTLHVLPGYGGVDPVTGMLSDYALRPDGWMFNLGLIVIGAGSAALWLALARHRVLTGALPTLAMTAWCAGLVCIAVFTKDAAHSFTAIGSVHLYVTATACGAMPVLCTLVGWRHRRHPQWRGHARTVFALAMANIPCVLPFLIAFALNRITGTEDYTGPATGLIERGMGVLDLVALVVFGFWAARAARGMRQVPAA